MNQKEFINTCYAIGMQNPWCSGRADFEDGEFDDLLKRLERATKKQCQELDY